MARLIHILHEPPGDDVLPVLQAQVRAGHAVEVVLTPGAGEAALPEGCAAHRLDPEGKPMDAEALLHLVYACDNAVSW